MFTPRLALAVGLSLTLSAAVAQDPKAPPAAPAKEAVKKAKSKLSITVPAEAKLLIEGKETGQADKTTRVFETPDLEVGKLYEYEFRATWTPNNYTTITRLRAVEFKGGDPIDLDLTKADPKMPDKVVIRWVPTPDDIVAKMVELGGVKKDDVAYEPGPGDGRVLIAAVKAGAKKAVGIELDPEKAKESREAVEKAGLKDKIEVREGDALKVDDYGNASIVFLYMGNEFNAAVRPHLEKALKPGSRIVSHRFTMGDWEPTKTIEVKGDDGDPYVLHLWVVKEKK